MKQFEVYELSLEIIRALAPLLTRIKRVDKKLEDQARRAATSVPLNLREGNRRHGKDRQYLFSVAHGSAEEVVATLDVSEAWGYLSEAATRSVRELLDRELAMLYRLTH